MKLIARFRNLLHGLFADWVGRREHENPAAVYEAAIESRTAQYGKLREAAAGVLYLRTKLSRELEQRLKDLGRVQRQLEVAVDEIDDPAALALIRRRNSLGADVSRLRAELAAISDEAEAAKKNLSTFHEELNRLRDERVHMVARLANAKARLRLHENLGGPPSDTNAQALEAVRDHINRLASEVNLSHELDRDGADEAIRRASDDEERADAEAELAELKRNRERTLLPLVVVPATEDLAAR